MGDLFGDADDISSGSDDETKAKGSGEEGEVRAIVPISKLVCDLYSMMKMYGVTIEDF